MKLLQGINPSENSLTKRQEVEIYEIIVQNNYFLKRLQLISEKRAVRKITKYKFIFNLHP